MDSYSERPVLNLCALPPAVPRGRGSHRGRLPPLHPPGRRKTEGGQLRDHRVPRQRHPLLCVQVCASDQVPRSGSLLLCGIRPVNLNRKPFFFFLDVANFVLARIRIGEVIGK